MTTARVPATALAVALALLPAGCGKDEQITVQGADAPAPAPTSAAPGAGDYTLEGAGATLSQDQAREALITAEDLPQGTWSQVPGEADDSGDDSKDVVEPAGCGAWLSKKPDTSAERVKEQIVFRSAADTRMPITLRYSMISFDDPRAAAANLAYRAEAPKSCGTFTITTPRGRKTEGSVVTLDFPRPGDASVATRMTMTTASGGGTPVSQYQDSIRVQVGHNVFVISLASEDQTSVDDLKSLVDKAFRRLESAAKQ